MQYTSSSTLIQQQPDGTWRARVSLASLNALAQEAWELFSGYRIWLPEGEPGAGKTTFLAALGHSIGLSDQVSSPSYSIVNEYADAGGNAYYHFDFYRIYSEEEALDIGCDEYFYSGKHCFIEWSSKIPGLIPEKHLKILLNLESDCTVTYIFAPQ